MADPLLEVWLFQEVVARKPFAYLHPFGPTKRHVRIGTRGRVILVTPNALAILFDGHVLPLRIDNLPGIIPLTLEAVEH